MKIVQKIILFLILFSFSWSVRAQTVHFGATFNPGLSKQSTNYFNVSIPGESRWALSGNVGLFVEKSFNKRSSLVVEALLLQIRSIDKSDKNTLYDVDENFELIEIGYLHNEWTANLFYVALPISYNCQFNKLGIRVGFQPMRYIYGKAKNRTYGVVNNVPYENNGTSENINFKNWDYGTRTGINYQLLEYLKFRVDYYHGFNDIILNEAAPFFRKSRQITIGADLYF